MVRRRVLVLQAIIAAGGLTPPRLLRLPAAADKGQAYRTYNRDPTANTRYIRPGGAGRRSGANWHHAAALADIDEMIALVGPGGNVHLLADAGPYTLADPITISHGGAAGNRIYIVGVDGGGAPTRALLIGNRTNPYPTTHEAFSAMNHGNDVFRLQDGADNLHFSFLCFNNIRNGAILVPANIADLTLEDIDAVNVTRFLERDSNSMCTIAGLTVRRVSVKGFSKSAFRLDQNTSAVTTEDVLGDSMHQDFDNFAEGIDLSGNVHDVVLRRCRMRNSQQRLGPEDFWNGDGFTSELHTSNILLEDCAAIGNTDAGFDLKSSNVTLRRCWSYANTANFKLWGQQGVVMEECVSENPLHMGGSQGPKHVTALWGANILVKNCRFIDHNPDAIVYHTDANKKADPPIGSTISVVNSTVSSSSELSFVNFNSRVSIDGIDRPFSGR